MKMNYLQRNKINNDGKKLVLILFIFFVIFLALFFFSTPVNESTSGTFESFFSYFAHLRINTGVMFSDLGSYFSSKQSLSQENTTLKDELQNLNLSLFSINALRDENTQLKTLAGRKTVKNSILSAVLARPTFSPYDTLIIDVGTDEGISVGNKVVVGNDIVIGRIDEVFQNTSRVKLYSSPGEIVRVMIGQNNVIKDATGIGGGNFELVVPKEISINEGDPVLFPSINLGIAGIVKKIEPHPADVSQTIIFSLPINLFELRFVTVEKSK